MTPKLLAEVTKGTFLPFSRIWEKTQIWKTRRELCGVIPLWRQLLDGGGCGQTADLVHIGEATSFD